MNEKLTWAESTARLGDIIPNPQNPKYSTEDVVKRLNDSIDTLGEFESLVVDHDGISAIDGHQRLNAWINHLGEDHVVSIRKPSRKLTEREIEKIILYSGKGTHGTFDFDMLALNFDFDTAMDLGGFEHMDLASAYGLDIEKVSDLDSDPPDDKYVETHSIIVVCADSDEQEQTYNRLMGMGLTLKVVSN